MATGSFDRTPPPFFRQGPSALSMMMFCSALAVFLMVADVRFSVTQPLLRGSGSRIVYEPLTQAERDLIYEVRSFERYRRSFAAGRCAFEDAMIEYHALREKGPE